MATGNRWGEAILIRQVWEARSMPMSPSVKWILTVMCFLRSNLSSIPWETPCFMSQAWGPSEVCQITSTKNETTSPASLLPAVIHQTPNYFSILDGTKFHCLQITVSKWHHWPHKPQNKYLLLQLYKSTRLLFISMNIKKKPAFHSTYHINVATSAPYSIILRSMEATSFSSLHLVIKSRYCMASRGRRPSKKKLNKCEWVPCITSIHCSNTLNCWSFPSSRASINGNTSRSSSWKCSLLWSYQHNGIIQIIQDIYRAQDTLFKKGTQEKNLIQTRIRIITA